MNIYCPKGTKALYLNPLSHFKGEGENETLIQRGYSFKITKAYKSGFHIYLDCDVILGSDENKYNDEDLKAIADKNYKY